LIDVGRPDESRDAYRRAYARMQQVRESLRDERLRAAFEKSGDFRFLRALPTV
jgi:hypothetical protein